MLRAGERDVAQTLDAVDLVLESLDTASHRSCLREEAGGADISKAHQFPDSVDGPKGCIGIEIVDGAKEAALKVGDFGLQSSHGGLAARSAKLGAQVSRQAKVVADEREVAFSCRWTQPPKCLADRREHSQAVTLVEGQPRLDQRCSRSIAAIGKERYEVLPGDASREPSD